MPEKASNDSGRRERAVREILGYQGQITGAADPLIVAGAALGWGIFLGTRQASGSDMPWAVLSGLLAGYLTLQLVDAPRAATLRNVLFGITATDAGYVGARAGAGL